MRLGDLGISRKLYESKSGIQFRIAAQDHYGPGITTLLTEHIIAVRALDAAESGPNGRYPFEQSGKFGNNNYPLSNLHQWLNSDSEFWFHPQHPLDTPPTTEHLRYGEHPYTNEPGFLCQFSDIFRKNLIKSNIPVLVRAKQAHAELQYTPASVFLPSRTEMNKGNELGIAEGKPLPIFYDHYIFKAVPSPEQIQRFGRSWNPEEPEKGLFFDQAQLYDPKFGWWYFMRTPNTMYKFLQRVMSPYGSVSYTYAYNDIVGLRPLINLNADLDVQDVGTAEPIYRIE